MRGYSIGGISRQGCFFHSWICEIEWPMGFCHAILNQSDDIGSQLVVVIRNMKTNFRVGALYLISSTEFDHGAVLP